MKIGVPGEFHEDRWQRTAEDYERRVIPRTREVGGTHRIQVIAWLSVLLTSLRHSHPVHRYFRGIPAWRRASRPVHDRQLTDALADLRHGDPAYKHLSGILAWRSILLTGLWHSHPVHRYFRGIPAWRTASRPVHDRQLTDALTGLWHGTPGYRWF